MNFLSEFLGLATSVSSGLSSRRRIMKVIFVSTGLPFS